ncbi:MAG: acyl-CoA dehydrogenase [Gammaproteobacteria bacterium]|nr:acyl-CoA dehydrogenase [Gammaproteobacteria bacterium]MCP4089260.1 acyl-CoA dehydrogenase [Gammaproteobacteria bacterium]MCP4275316.1 acyl-CoA dehydrogenase [Gammaproteobacteria bacterium]MCP4830900.1 acyl-CoA dehydrogenase [Gammaproteobacteria bacterium]MCP4929525.1 acyl-CoA dehydrogenase [Gammaproteobacteria bacterium]
MSDYRAPVKDMRFVINELAELEKIAGLPGYEEATPDMVEAVLEGAAQLASEVIAPTNAIGDEQGARVENGQVIVPPEFHTAYKQYVEDGWPGIGFNPEFGGQGLPALMAVAVEEMLQSANLAWSLCPMLTHGAIHALESHGSDALKAIYLEKMIAGEWTGTMNLTEPQAGSDLSVVRSSAVPDGDAWKVSGQKIFITWGDHDITENVIHLVLARTPDAPAGVKGLSLFIVPKFLVNEDSSLGERNTVTTVSLEHKLGIHGSPTCVLDFENATGYLIGAEGDGLACMFTMMNSARLGVGLEGVSVAERSYQHALAYALERVQGRAPGHDGNVAIVEHPDVRRMLLTMKAEVEAMRAVAYVANGHLDQAERNEDAEQQAFHKARVDLLTPIVKGWITERAQELTSLGLQVHGGMGYVEESGAAQYMRDARILTIYEGTTGIQAGDLIGRKVLRDKGLTLQKLLDEINAVAGSLDGELADIATALAMAVEDAKASLTWLLEHHASDPTIPGGVSYHFLMLLGTLCGGWQMARSAKVAREKLTGGDADTDFYNAKILSAKFYVEQTLPKVAAHSRSVKSGSATMMAFTLDQLRGE